MISINGGTGTIAGIAVGGLPDGTVDADTLATQAVTPPKLSGAQTGNPPVFGIRAWCSYNGLTTGTNPPTAGGNISAVTRNSTGNYTIAFVQPMPNADYFVGHMAKDPGTLTSLLLSVEARTINSVNIQFRNTSSTSVDPNPAGIFVVC